MNFPIWINSNLYKSAKLVAVPGNRTASQQVQYWAQVGRACIDNPDLPVDFVIDSLESLKVLDSEKEFFTRILI
jgi:hypothetical protein